MVTVLWSRHLSAPNSSDPHRDLHLSEILAKIQQCPALVGSEPTIQHKLNFVQAEILLATYFFAMGCVTDGQYHTSAAVSLTFGQQATQEDSLRGQRMPYPFGDVILPSTHPSHSTNTLLCGARTWEDRMEEECTNASYTVYIMDRTWTTLSGVPSTAAAPPIGVSSSSAGCDDHVLKSAFRRISIAQAARLEAGTSRRQRSNFRSARKLRRSYRGRPTSPQDGEIRHSVCSHRVLPRESMPLIPIRHISTRSGCPTRVPRVG